MMHVRIQVQFNNSILHQAFSSQIEDLPDFHIVSEGGDVYVQESENALVISSSSGNKDFLIFPFHFSTFLIKIKALIRQGETLSGTYFSIGPYRFFPGTKTLEKDRDVIRLTEKEVAILLYLLKSQSDVVSRDELLHQVWGYHSDVTTHTLETHIYRLRQKIESDPAHARLLVTDALGGYRLLLT